MRINYQPVPGTGKDLTVGDCVVGWYHIPWKDPRNSEIDDQQSPAHGAGCERAAAGDLEGSSWRP